MNKQLALAVILGVATIGAAAYAKGPKSDFSRFDEDGDGKVAISELDARHKEFIAEADRDGDGYIAKDEMEAMHEERMAEHQARRFPDANNNGVVDRREFEDAAREKFNKLDANGDGLISKEEMDAQRGHHRRGH